MVYIGVDLHRNKSQVAAIDESGTGVRPVLIYVANVRARSRRTEGQVKASTRWLSAALRVVIRLNNGSGLDDTGRIV